MASKLPLVLSSGEPQQIQTGDTISPVALLVGRGFRANLNGSNMTGLTTGDNKVTATTEVFDVGSYYDAANSKWTPPAGVVKITAQTLVLPTTTFSSPDTQSFATLRIFKNGSQVVQGLVEILTASHAPALFAVLDDNANGSDYYELYVFVDTALLSSGRTYIVSGSISNTAFSGIVLG